MAHLFPAQSGSSKIGVIPLQDLRDAIRPIQDEDCAECDLQPLSRPTSRMHDFVATDDGIANGFAPQCARSAWEHSRSSAFSNMKDSEVIQGLLLPCLTYGKGQFEIGQAKKGRTGNADPADFNACNPSCMAYAAISTILPCESQPKSAALENADEKPEEFGGGILAHQQSKEITRFYELRPKCETTKNVFAHNATTIRNLAEIRHHEKVPPVETQYRSHPSMVMQPLRPEALSAQQGQGGTIDSKDLSSPKTMSLVERMDRIINGKGPVDTTVKAPPPSPGWKSFTNLVAEEQAAHNAGPLTVPQAGNKITTEPAGGESFTSRSTATTGQQNAHNGEEAAAAGDITTGGTGIESSDAHTKGKGKAVARPDGPTKDESSARIGLESTDENTKTKVAPANTSQRNLTNFFKRSQKRNAPQDRVAAERTSASPTAATQQGQTTHGGTEMKAESEKSDAAATTESSKGVFGGLLQKAQKSKDKDLAKEMQAAASSIAKLSAEATKAAEGIKLGNIPQIKIGEGPMPEEAKDEALRRYQDMLAAGGSDPFTLLMSVENFGALDAITELPPARAHSISEDTVLTGNLKPLEEHDLSIDTVVSTGKAAPAHALADDRVINVEPSKRGTHRLSTDAMIPIRAAAPGHHLDADPTISGPKQLFPHELLDDKQVLRSKSPQPHNLDMDQTLAASQQQSRAHDLHSDAVLAAPQARTAHDLHSDLLVKSIEPVTKGHDLAHDVRILSPSGAVRDPHSIGDDEIIKENAVFRKSPHPDAMIPGQWAASSSSGASDVNIPMASLNASLQTAGQALDKLNQSMGATSQAKEAVTGQSQSGSVGHSGRTATGGPGFWGKVFRRGEGPEMQARAAL